MKWHVGWSDAGSIVNHSSEFQFQVENSAGTRNRNSKRYAGGAEIVRLRGRGPRRHRRMPVARINEEFASSGARNW